MKGSAQRIRAAELAQRAGISQSKLNQWGRARLVRLIGKDGADRDDVITVALATVLMEKLHGIEETRRALSQLTAVQPDVSPEAVVVWDEELELATLAQTDREIVEACRHGRPVRVIPVGTRLREVIASVDRLLEDRWRGPQATPPTFDSGP